MLPVIGISVTRTVVENCSMEAVNRVYVDAVTAAGGLAVILPTLDPDLAGPLLDCLDAVVLSGGGDVDPSHFGQQPTPALRGVDGERDAWEMALARHCWERKMPVLGICRGMQVMNVARGGTLHQHLPDRSPLAHRQAPRFADLVHTVTLAEGSLAAAVLGGAEVGANSLHHQAVDEPGEGLVATGWAEDATVEVIESRGDTAFLGVQWHPELLTAHHAHRRLFDWVVTQARLAHPVVMLGTASAPVTTTPLLAAAEEEPGADRAAA